MTDTKIEIPDVVGTRCPECNKGTIMVEVAGDGQHKLWCEQFHNWLVALP